MNGNLSGTSCHSSWMIPVRWWCMQMQTLLHDNLQLLILIHASTEISQLVIQFAFFLLFLFCHGWRLFSFLSWLETYAQFLLLLRFLLFGDLIYLYIFCKHHKALRSILLKTICVKNDMKNLTSHWWDFFFTPWQWSIFLTFSQKLFQHRGCFCMALVEQLRDDGRW